MNREEKQLIHYQNTHKEINGIIHKQCSICGEWFIETLDNFYKKKDKLSPYCKECEKSKNYNWLVQNYDKHPIYMKKDYEKRKDKYLESANKQRESGYSKEWQQNNPEKLKGYGERYSNKAHNILQKEWINCKKYFDNCCAYCGMTEVEHKKIYNQQLHKEHVDCNGEGNLQNCVPSCKSCNCSKHTDNMEEWYKKQTFFSEDKLDKIHKWINIDYQQYIQEHKPKGKYTKKDNIYWNSK